MTHEQAIEILDDNYTVLNTHGHYTEEEEVEALQMAIKALEQKPCDNATLKDIFCMGCEYKEQEPCNDCISRQAVIGIVSEYAERFNGYIDSPNDSEVYAYARGLLLSIEKNINAVPSVTPQPKTGHRIYIPQRRLVDETDEGGVFITDFRCTCSECGGDFGFQIMRDAYCKYCGARMQEVKE